MVLCLTRLFVAPVVAAATAIKTLASAMWAIGGTPVR